MTHFDGEVRFLGAEISMPTGCFFSHESLGGGTVRIVVIVDGPDALFARVVAAGATVVLPVDNQ